MSLAGEYRRQRAWRDWDEVLDALPLRRGETVLDLGCGIGDQAELLVARGARVIGFDADEELLRVARGRGIAGAEFRAGDLRTLPDPGVVADGLWSSFAAAYLADLSEVLAAWRRHLRPGGWIALTEIDDLFGHEPLDRRTRELLEEYGRDALAAGRYDFHAGRKTRAALEAAGFTVTRELLLFDRELAFDGPAPPEVIDAWRARLERMKLLRAAAGPDFEALREDFLACLARADHRSRARVVCCIATG